MQLKAAAVFIGQRLDRDRGDAQAAVEACGADRAPVECDEWGLEELLASEWRDAGQAVV